MTVDLNRLKSMKKDELLVLAKQLNAPHHHKNSEQTLVENIINHVLQPQPVMQAEEAKPVKRQPVWVSQEQLEAEITPIKERKKAFSSHYDEESRSVTFKYNDGRYRHSETLSLSTPLRTLKHHATIVAKGPYVLRPQRSEDWETISRTDGPNAYTNTVL